MSGPTYHQDVTLRRTMEELGIAYAWCGCVRGAGACWHTLHRRRGWALRWYRGDHRNRAWTVDQLARAVSAGRAAAQNAHLESLRLRSWTVLSSGVLVYRGVFSWAGDQSPGTSAVVTFQPPAGGTGNFPALIDDQMQS